MAGFQRDSSSSPSATLRDFLFPNVQPNVDVTARATGKRLSRHIGDPVRHGTRTLILKEFREAHAGPKGPLTFHVQARSEGI